MASVPTAGIRESLFDASTTRRFVRKGRRTCAVPAIAYGYRACPRREERLALSLKSTSPDDRELPRALDDGRAGRAARSGAPLRRRGSHAQPEALVRAGCHRPRRVAQGGRAGHPAARCLRRLRRLRRQFRPRGDHRARAVRGGQYQLARRQADPRDRRALHRALRHRGAEAPVAAAPGQRRDHRRHGHDRTRRRHRPAEHPDTGRARRRRLPLPHPRRQDLHHQRLHRRPAGAGGEDRFGRAGQGRVAVPVRDQHPGLPRRAPPGEDRPAWLRYLRAVLRRAARKAGLRPCSAKSRGAASTR